MKKPQTIYIGFVDGKPQFWNVVDEYGLAEKLEGFLRKKDAKARYEDVRKMKLVEVK